MIRFYSRLLGLACLCLTLLSSCSTSAQLSIDRNQEIARKTLAAKNTPPAPTKPIVYFDEPFVLAPFDYLVAGTRSLFGGGGNAREISRMIIAGEASKSHIVIGGFSSVLNQQTLKSALSRSESYGLNGAVFFIFGDADDAEDLRKMVEARGGNLWMYAQ